MKLEMKYDKLCPNTVELKIFEESHTLANMVVERFLSDKNCTFAAYKKTHPQDDFVLIKVSAKEEIPVRMMIIENLKKMVADIDKLVEQSNQQLGLKENLID